MTIRPEIEICRKAADIMLPQRNFMWVADPATQAGPCIVMDGITEERANQLLSRYGGSIKQIG
tara:strand:+ start:265 stop:453 length:189 start_codon:yes stop_codon:yes gene_type:complete